MKKTSTKYQKTGSRISRFLSAVLILILLFSALSICTPANAALIINPRNARGTMYKVEITHDSKASGWNKATLKINYKYGDRYEQVDLTDEFAKGETITKTYELLSAIPSSLQLYLDFGGGFTVRSHSGRIKLYADDEEILNEPYSARSYPFNSSDATLDFGIYGITETEVIDPDGGSTIYPTVKQAWSKAKERDGSTVKLTNKSSVTGSLEATNNITVDLNGQLMNNTETTPLFHVKSGGKLKLIDSDPTRDTGETFFCAAGITGYVDDYESRTYRLKGGGVYHGGSEESGGVIRVESGGELSVTGCSFTDCHSATNGGVIYNEGKMTLNGTKFLYCTAMKGSGGAICLSEKNESDIKNLTFERCEANVGGAICFLSSDNASKVTNFDKCTFIGCKAKTDGGAVAVTGNTTITANALTFNRCQANYGGGVNVRSSAPFALNKSKFDFCSSDRAGGGLCYKSGADMTLNNVEVSNCNSQKHGAGLELMTYGAGGYEININDCNIHNCTSENEGGGLFIYDDNSDTDKVVKTIIKNTTVTNNLSDKGAGIYAESHFVYLIDSRIYKNQAWKKPGGGIYVDSMRDIEVAGATVIRDNTANGKLNNLCLQDGLASSAKLYSGGLYDGAYIGISTTTDGRATVAKNISQYQVNKYLHADDYVRSFTMKNTEVVSTPLYASMISENASLFIIIGGIVVIAGVIIFLYLRKRRKEGKKNDEAKAQRSAEEADEENE